MELLKALTMIDENHRMVQRYNKEPYPFYYFHIFEKGSGRISICETSGQVSFIEPTFTVDQIMSEDWIIINDS